MRARPLFLVREQRAQEAVFSALVDEYATFGRHCMSAPAPIPVTIDDAAIVAARQWWQTHARKPDRTLLDGGMPDERRAGRALDYAIAHSNRTTVATLAEQLRARTLTPDAWEVAMQAEVTAARICGVACGVGWQMATPAFVARYV